MRVFLTLLEKTVRASRADKPPDPENELEIKSGEMLGSIPYAELRKLGNGEHDLPIKYGDFQVKTDPEWRRQTVLIAAIVLLVTAPLSWYMLNDLEKQGGSMRVHWAVAMAYNMGGKNVVALFQAVLAVFGIGYWWLETEQARRKEEKNGQAKNS